MSNAEDKSQSVGELATLTETNVKQGFRAYIQYEIEILFTDSSEIVQDYS